MKILGVVTTLGAALLLAACGRGKEASWLTQPDAAVHTARYFPVDARSIHGGGVGARCEDCHGDPAFTTFRQFDCIHCHEGRHADPASVTAWHSGVAGFTFDSVACFGCHPQGRATMVNHGAYFPVGPGTRHETAACVSCHVDPASRLVLGCAGCHGHEQATMGSAHSLVSGYAFSSPLCVRCHADAQVNPVASHLPFRITAGARHAGPGSDGACLVCHPGWRTDKTWATDFTTFACAGPCHDPHKATFDAAHVAVSGYAYPDCYRCHPSGKP